MKIRYSSNFNSKKNEILFDFDYNIILINRVYFRKYLSNLKIKKLPFFISI